MPNSAIFDILDIDKACRRLLALPALVSEVFPRDFLVADLVLSEVVPPAPSATRVVVSELGPLLGDPRWLSCSKIPVLLPLAPV